MKKIFKGVLGGILVIAAFVIVVLIRKKKHVDIVYGELENPTDEKLKEIKNDALKKQEYIDERITTLEQDEAAEILDKWFEKFGLQD